MWCFHECKVSLFSRYWSRIDVLAGQSVYDRVENTFYEFLVFEASGKSQ